MIPARSHSRGFTLTEVTVVIVLAAVVMTGLTVFYFNSQATWVEGSSQAITQREATLVTREIANRTRAAAAAFASGSPHASLTLKMSSAPGGPAYRFWWEPADSLVHEEYDDAMGLGPHDMGSLHQSKAAAFAVQTVGGGLVVLDSLTLITPQNTRITLGSSTALINRGAP